jgi:hypothetical protein
MIQMACGCVQAPMFFFFIFPIPFVTYLIVHFSSSIVLMILANTTKKTYFKLVKVDGTAYDE